MWIAGNWTDYEVLDTTGGEKLERWGDYFLVRPDPQVIWNTGKDDRRWSYPNGHYHRSKKGGGSWQFRDLPEVWQIGYNAGSKDLTFNLKPFSFKHTGLFPEQAVNWDWMTQKIAAVLRERAGSGQGEASFSVLNLFAYTGGATLACAAAGAKVVKKAAPDEKVGAMCLEDGKPSIIEYYDMTPELMAAKNEKGDPAFNFGVILNYLFRVADLERIMNDRFPLHIVEKKIPYMAKDGTYVKPEKPNGYKFESLVLDMIHQLDSCLPFEVRREYEFAPIKNKTGIDSVESARELCRQNGIEL